MIETSSFEQKCHFTTKRLVVRSWKHQITETTSKHDFAQQVMTLLSPEVTKSLPDGWQQVDSQEKALDWINQRAEESVFLTVQTQSDGVVVGFVFLDISSSSEGAIDLRLGYLLSEAVWGKGLGSELIQGLVEWCEAHPSIKSLSGGVERDNIGSIKVLEKNGFQKVPSSVPSEEMLFLERRFAH